MHTAHHATRTTHHPPRTTQQAPPLTLLSLDERWSSLRSACVPDSARARTRPASPIMNGMPRSTRPYSAPCRGAAGFLVPSGGTGTRTQVVLTAMIVSHHRGSPQRKYFAASTAVASPDHPLLGRDYVLGLAGAPANLLMRLTPAIRRRPPPCSVPFTLRYGGRCRTYTQDRHPLRPPTSDVY